MIVRHISAPDLPAETAALMADHSLRDLRLTVHGPITRGELELLALLPLEHPTLVRASIAWEPHCRMPLLSFRDAFVKNERLELLAVPDWRWERP